MTAQLIDWTTAMTSKRPAAKAAKTCEQLSVDLSAYFDGELEGVELAAVEAHLAGCDPCSQKLAQMRKLRSAMSGLAANMPRRGSVLDLLRAELRGEGGGKADQKHQTH